MRITSLKSSAYPKLMLVSLLAISGTGQASTATQAAKSPSAPPAANSPAPGTSPAPGAQPSPAQAPTSPFEKSKVQLDFETMEKDNPDFSKTNTISPSTAGGAGGQQSSRSGVVLPKGTRLATIVKNSCLRGGVSAQNAGSSNSTGSSGPTGSIGPMSRQVSKTRGPIENLDIQAYSTVTNREMTVNELKEQAENDPCVIGVSNDAKVQLDPMEMQEEEAVSTNGRDDTAEANSSANDPRLGEQAFMKTIKADSAYNTFYDAKTGITQPVVIAVVDTGVKHDHPDLATNMWTDANGHHGYDFVNRDNDPMDDGGHGTHCAGLAAAVRNNGVGVSGVMGTNAKIMAVKALNSSGSGYVSDIVNSINYAAKNGANVISMSFGGPGQNAAYQAAVANAVKGGATLFASAGNDNRHLTNSSWTSPGSYARDIAGFVSVGSIDSNSLNKSWFSNFSSSGYVEIASPGNEGILSTLKNGGYGEKSGTSMAAPVTAGAGGLAIGLIKSRGYPAPPDLIEQLLEESGNSRPNLNAFFKDGKVLDLERLAQLIDSRFPPK